MKDLAEGFVFHIGKGAAIELFGNFRERRVLGDRVAPAEVEDGVGELAAVLAIEFTDFEEDTGEDFLIESGFSRRRYGSPFPLQPARGVDECAVLFREARAREAIDFG